MEWQVHLAVREVGLGPVRARNSQAQTAKPPRDDRWRLAQMTQLAAIELVVEIAAGPQASNQSFEWMPRIAQHSDAVHAHALRVLRFDSLRDTQVHKHSC
jgi:hypothetical protein